MPTSKTFPKAKGTTFSLSFIIAFEEQAQFMMCGRILFS
ncbi:hypothetical protein GPAL_3806 [Glaciecola pallidula DSM 14239 = ACAM 615]|uniref:Uncharacterized protein n=1 Tax=Brumicola pallidula DSM 14239 = ACAM 615 TaxID=1121922 RepID=K6Z326_9ALTE|nr:hypothetical protein GPAL_3806 [Glaciecola pallidula DSM 14239 = ACAM 615]